MQTEETMSCNNCNCLDCTRNRAIAKAKNLMNDMGDLGAPIQRPRWQDVEPGNENQTKAWGIIADHILDREKGMSLLQLVNRVCNSISGLKPANRPKIAAQVERFLRESPKYRTIKLSVNPNVVDDRNSTIDNYTCKGCGNTKCSTQEKSCWRCGREVGK